MSTTKKLNTKVIVSPFHKVSYCAIVYDRIEDDIRLKRDENGNCIYVKVGEKNISEYVNSFKNTSSLQALLSRISLLPINEKLQCLNQTSDGVYADVSGMPTDATAAFIMLQKYKSAYPDIAAEIAKGKTFEEVISTYFKPKEVSSNGENESSVE